MGALNPEAVRARNMDSHTLAGEYRVDDDPVREILAARLGKALDDLDDHQGHIGQEVEDLIACIERAQAAADILDDFKDRKNDQGTKILLAHRGAAGRSPTRANVRAALIVALENAQDLLQRLDDHVKNMI